MNTPLPLMRNMPGRSFTTGDYINFVQQIRESVDLKNSRSGNLAFNTILLASMTNSYVEGVCSCPTII